MKLYWRIKKDGSWTWKPAQVELHWDENGSYYVVRAIGVAS